MKSGFGVLVMAMVLLLAAGAWSQSQSQDDTGSATDTQVQQGPKPEFTYPDTTPSLDFLSQAAENSSLTLGIGGGIGYYNNIYRVSNNNQSRVIYDVRPIVKIQQFRPNLAWKLSYAGGLQTYSQPSTVRTGGYNTLFSQNAGVDILWQIAHHWQLHALDDFVYSANPFDSYLTNPGTPTVNNPAPETFFPLSRYTRNNGLLELTHQLTLHDTLDFSGTSYLRRTANADLVTVPFYNLVSYAGRASYNHQFSPQLTLGAGYNYNSMDFGHGVQRTGAQTIMLSAEYLIRPHIVLSGWIGPEYSSTKSIVSIPILGLVFYQTVHTSMWSTAGGLTLGWQGIRNSFRANFSRQVSDGGGILATTQTYRAGATFRRQLRPRWYGEVGISYWNNTSITIANRKFSYALGSLSVSHEISRSFNATFQYAYSKENQENVFLGAPGYNQNRIQFTVDYNWHHPLGR